VCAIDVSRNGVVLSRIEGIVVSYFQVIVRQSLKSKPSSRSDHEQEGQEEAEKENARQKDEVAKAKNDCFRRLSIAI
jgi:hypothetical protein